MANPLEAYGKVLTERGLGTPKTKLEAMIESGDLTDPLKRFPVKKGSGVDDVQRFFMGLGNVLKAGGASKAPGGAFSPYVVPENVEEATKQIVEASEGNIFEFVPPPGYEENLTVGKKIEPGTRFSTADVETSGGQGKLGTKDAAMRLTGAGDSALAQLGAIQREEQKAQDAEDFRAKEAKIAEAQGMPQENLVGKGVDVPDEAVETLFNDSLDEYIAAAKKAEFPGAGAEKTKDEYLKEFAEFTGMDISGKPKIGNALTMLGLSLMQNRAGKGFNVGRILSEVGKAGEKAMPELIAAKKEAKQNRLLAGKYALESRSKDRATAAEAKLKAMQKSKYYIMPKSEGISGFLSIMDESKPTFLNAAEFSALVDNPDFDKGFDIITEERFAGLVKQTLDSKEAVDLFGTTKSDVFLFSDDADKMFSFKVNDINPNLPEGKSPRFGKMTNPGQADQIYRGLADALGDINKFEESFAGAIADIDEGGATLQAQVQNFLIQAADRIGVEVNAETATADLKKFVTKLQAQNAAEILGEAGKTLSDKDRQLVAEIVGDLPGLLTGSPDILRSKLLELKTRVLDNKRREILRAFQTMDNYTRNDYSELYGDAEWSDDDQTRLLELRKQQGAK